jgi:cell division protein FtsI/penicillin-binding protein 2
MNVRGNIIFKYIIVYGFLVIAGIAVVVQMVHIQIDKKDWATAELAKRAFRKVEVLARRGDILAHDGQIMVTSMQKYRLYYDFNADGL